MITAYTDATFSITPQKFSQTLNFVVRVRGCYLLLFTAVMTSKKTQLYTDVFAFLRKELRDVEIGYIKSDYEEALMKSVELAFEGVPTSGCYFHFCQAIFK